MRQITVADPARSVVFYRDALGFEVREVSEGYGFSVSAEVAFGPALIQFGVRDNHEHSPSTGSNILFFQTDDVAAMHANIRARGAQPSELEKVNWIKMQMFEVRDPDGHTLWFGESYDGPDAPRPRGQLRKIMPNLPLNDVPAGVAYYCEVLGFRLNYAQNDLGVMDRDEVTVVLIARTVQHKGIGSCYVYVNDADALHAELLARGANVQGAPVSHPWGLRDFRVLDLDGNQITFGQPFE